MGAMPGDFWCVPEWSTELIIVVLSAAAGMLLALLRFPVLSLVPVVVFFAAGSALVAGAPTETIIDVIGSIAAPQFAYLGVSLAVELTGWLRQHFDAERHAQHQPH